MSFGYGDGTVYWNWAGASLVSGTMPLLPMTAAVRTGNRYMFALDMDAGRLWVGQNGIWYNSGNPATSYSPLMTGLTGTVHAGVTFYPHSLDSFSANFGGSPFTYPVPAGFHAGLY
jgi:hypothetical protein